VGSNFDTELLVTTVDCVHGPLVAHHPEEVIVGTFVSLIRNPQGQVEVCVTSLLRSISKDNVDYNYKKSRPVFRHIKINIQL